MERIDVEGYIREMKGLKDNSLHDFYSLKKELNNLSGISSSFDEFEKETMNIDKATLSQIHDLSALMSMKNLASELKSKKDINEKLHTLHLNLSVLKNSSAGSLTPIRDQMNSFLLNKDTKIERVIEDLNDFKSKLDKLRECHSKLRPKSLDAKIDTKYEKHIEKLSSIHKRQKKAFVSAVSLFFKYMKKHIASLKKV